MSRKRVGIAQNVKCFILWVFLREEVAPWQSFFSSPRRSPLQKSQGRRVWVDDQRIAVMGMSDGASLALSMVPWPDLVLIEESIRNNLGELMVGF